MQYRPLGQSGLQVSVLGIGCNNFGGRLDFEQSKAVIHQALDLGVNLFDTADVYPMTDFGASETIIGKALGSARHQAVLATKFGMVPPEQANELGGSRRYICSAVEASLQRLQSDHIDLLYYHKPDGVTPIDETLRALDDLIAAGKVRYIGCSNFAGWQAVEARYVARELGTNRFICAQEELSLLRRQIEPEILPALVASGMGLIPYFPLASGLLTGKYSVNAPMPEGARLTNNQPLAKLFVTDSNLELADSLRNFAEQKGHSLIELAFSWLLAKSPVASVIAGASTPEQVAVNADATNWQLSTQDIAEIDRLCGFNPPWGH